ncbi:hypothetical protein KOR34_48780 [Posidoniimonas corsicana]|uniref:Uncharacterized protein n=1 Tax=Posidoniimonas corsicana TaxID=1938618 RepID=A0A5C5UXH4_9BACT|nr:hypothetical protein [Posidoniimonas corsicana]TWT30320.1 hypothetical protein KOR34_48780 [Posidoniimonas corsicana]
MSEPTAVRADRPDPGPLALGCLVLAFVVGRTVLHLQWVKDTDSGANFESGLVMGYPVVLGVWAALAPHALGPRMVATAVVYVGLMLPLGLESALPTAVLMLAIAGLVGLVLRAADLRLACGEHPPTVRPLRLSLRQLLLATTLAAVGCGWAAGVAGDQFEELADEWPIMAFSLVYLSVTLSPAVFASLLLAGPARWRLVVASVAFSPPLFGLLGALVVALSPFADDYAVSLSSQFLESVVEFSAFAAGAQWAALIGFALMSWAGYRMVRVAPGEGNNDHR